MSHDPQDKPEEKSVPSTPDPHGQAALMLTESLIHGLLDRGLLSVEDALDIARCAAEVKLAVVSERDEPAEAGNLSLQLLDRIAESLSVDLDESLLQAGSKQKIADQ